MHLTLPTDTSSLLPSDPETLLTRRAAADALTAAGFPVRPATLATLACRGGGPEYRLFGKRPLYRWDDVLQWAKGRLSAPRRNSSEGDVACREPDKANEGNDLLVGAANEASPKSQQRRKDKGRRTAPGEAA